MIFIKAKLQGYGNFRQKLPQIKKFKLRITVRHDNFKFYLKSSAITSKDKDHIEKK
jgi:hypothetical protein